MAILGELIEEGQEASRIRRDAGEKDFFAFCSTYFPHYFGSEPAEYHRILMDVVSSGALSQDQVERLSTMIRDKYHPYMVPTNMVAGIIDVEPRGFSKSTRFSLAFPIWVTVYKKRNFPILFASSQRQANENLESIKEEFDQNELLFQDFGEMRSKIWKADKITLSNGTAIVARGAGASTRGIKNGPHRPDVAICDDIMTDEMAGSKVQRDKRYRWFKRVVLPLGKDILPVLINTIFHEDDIVCRLLAELTDGKLKNWVGFRFAARTPTGESLWPDYWTEERLRKKEDELGSAAWSTEMMNEPLSSEDSIIKRFHYYKLSELPNLTRIRKYGGIDPATGAHDKCAEVTVGDGEDGVLYVLDSWGRRLDEPAFLDAIIDTHILYSHESVGFEDVAFQTIYKNNLIEKAASRGVYLPIFGRKAAGMSKQGRVKKMAPRIEAGLIRFLETQRELVDQLSMMTPDGPKSAFDDEADGLFYAVEEADAAKGSSGVIAVATAKASTLVRSVSQSIISKIRRNHG